MARSPWVRGVRLSCDLYIRAALLFTTAVCASSFTYHYPPFALSLFARFVHSETGEGPSERGPVLVFIWLRVFFPHTAYANQSIFEK